MANKPVDASTLTRNLNDRKLSAMANKAEAISESPLDTDRMDLLWESMIGIFGRLWSDNFPISAQGAWNHALREKTLPEIRFGIQQLQLWPNHFPPNAMEFSRLCRITFKDIGLDDYHESFRRCQAGKARHHVETSAWEFSGGDSLVFREYFDRFRRVYLRKLRGLPVSGEQMVPALPSTQSGEVARDSIKNIKDILHGK